MASASQVLSVEEGARERTAEVGRAEVGKQMPAEGGEEEEGEMLIESDEVRRVLRGEI